MYVYVNMYIYVFMFICMYLCIYLYITFIGIIVAATSQYNDLRPLTHPYGGCSGTACLLIRQTPWKTRATALSAGHLTVKGRVLELCTTRYSSRHCFGEI